MYVCMYTATQNLDGCNAALTVSSNFEDEHVVRLVQDGGAGQPDRDLVASRVHDVRAFTATAERSLEQTISQICYNQITVKIKLC